MRASEAADPARVSLNATQAAEVAGDVYDQFKGKGVSGASTYEKTGGFGVSVALQPGPQADQVAAEVRQFIAQRSPVVPDVRIDWQRSGEELVPRLRNALGAHASKIEVSADGITIEAGTAAKDLSKLQQQAERVAEKKFPGLPIRVRPFRSAVSFGDVAFAEGD